MEKRVLFWAGFVIILFIVLTKTPLISSLLSLLVLGIVPGTDLVIPAWIILTLYPVLGVLGIHWLRTQSLFIGERTKPVQPTKAVVKKRKPRKTTAHAKHVRSAKSRARAAV